MQETTKQIIDAIKPVAEKIGEGAAHLYEVYTRQMFAEGVAGLIKDAVAAILAIIALLSLIKIAKMVYKWNADSLMHDDGHIKPVNTSTPLSQAEYERERDKIIEGLKRASDWEYVGTSDHMPENALTSPQARQAIDTLVTKRAEALVAEARMAAYCDVGNFATDAGDTSLMDFIDSRLAAQLSTAKKEPDV